MATIILGQHPDALEVRLVRGDKAVMVATLVDATGAPTPWPSTPSLVFAAGRTKEPIIDGAFAATVDGEHATWTLTVAQVEAIAAASGAPGQDWLSTLARITTPEGGDTDGSVEYVGPVVWSDGWTAGTRTQQVTFTLPGQPGAAGASAYDVAVANGFVGTEAEWLESLIGTGAEYDDTVLVAALAAHAGSTSNPHAVTKAQVGLGAVDNTGDLAKPISTATQAALDLKPNVPLFAIRTTDATVNNSVALTNDTQLVVPLDANSTYEFHGFLIFSNVISAAADAQISFTVPSGATGSWFADGAGLSVGSSGNTSVGRKALAYGASDPVGTPAGTPMAIGPRGFIVTAATPGNLTLQWAQNVATASDTKLLATSYLVARKIA